MEILRSGSSSHRSRRCTATWTLVCRENPGTLTQRVPVIVGRSPFAKPRLNAVHLVACLLTVGNPLLH